MTASTSFLDQLTGSFAMPAAENPTVAMVEAAYRHHGLAWRYINCEVAPAHLADAVRGARAMGWAGFNCSLPHKVAVIEHLDGLGESASIMGAVNCVVRRGDALIGENLHLMQDVSRRTALLGTARHRDDAVRAELVAADDDPHEGLMRRRSHRRFAQRVVALKAVADRRAARFFPVETHGERPFAP